MKIQNKRTDWSAVSEQRSADSFSPEHEPVAQPTDNMTTPIEPVEDVVKPAEPVVVDEARKFMKKKVVEENIEFNEDGTIGFNGAFMSNRRGNPNYRQINVFNPIGLDKKVKQLCLEEDISQQELISLLLVDVVEKGRVPQGVLKRYRNSIK